MSDEPRATANVLWGVYAMGGEPLLAIK